jgi:large subunit ribosomal protein L25
MAASDTITLAATVRNTSGKGPARSLRRTGEIPAVVYGLGADNVSVSVPAHDLDLILHSETGVNSVITLDVGNESVLTLCRQIQRHPVRGTLVHVDFIRVRADQTITADVNVNLLEDPIGVKAGGRLEQLLFNITIEARPGNIPTSIDHDVSEMNIGDQLLIGDLKLPSGVVAQAEADQLVAQVVPPRVAAEEEGEGAEGAAGGAEEGAGAAESDSGGE